MISSCGGTLLTSIILGQPIGWLSNDRIVLSYVIAYLISYFAVSRSILIYVLSSRLVAPIVLLMRSYSWGHSITSWGVDRAVHSYSPPSLPPSHMSISYALVCGILSSCGGGLLKSGLALNEYEWRLQTPLPIKNPSIHLVVSAFCSCLYYLLCNPHKCFPVTLLPELTAKSIIHAIALLSNLFILSTQTLSAAKLKAKETKVQ